MGWLFSLLVVLAVLLGFWAFTAAASIGLKILFWVCVVLIVLLAIGSVFRRPTA